MQFFQAEENGRVFPSRGKKLGGSEKIFRGSEFKFGGSEFCFRGSEFFLGVGVG